MVRRFGWLALATGLGGCPFGTDVFMDGFIGDTAVGPGVDQNDCVAPVLDFGPSVQLDRSGLGWVRLAAGVAPDIQLDGPTGSYRPATVTLQRVAADGSTLLFFRPEAGWETGMWSAWISWPIQVTVLDPETLEVLSSASFCTDQITRGLQVEAPVGSDDPSVVRGLWWLRQGLESPDGRLLTRVLDAGRPPAGRALALDVGADGIGVGARLRTAGVPLDACDPADPMELVPTDAGVRWHADAVTLGGADGGDVVLRDLTLDLPGQLDDDHQRIQLATTVDLRGASDTLRGLACDTWAPEAGLACGPCPDDATATACLPLLAPGLLLERPPVAADDAPAECP
jgi:hypothetical protein